MEETFIMGHHMLRTCLHSISSDNEIHTLFCEIKFKRHSTRKELKKIGIKIILYIIFHLFIKKIVFIIYFN